MSEHCAGRLDRQSLPSRLRISYNLEFASGTIERELPFVIGVMADLSGYRRQPMPRLRDRKFVQIDRGNFDRILASIAPSLRLELTNELGHGEDRMAVDLYFKSLSDFEPHAVANQVAPLRDALIARNRLSDLRLRAHIAAERLKLAEHAKQIVIGLGVIAEELDDVPSWIVG